MIKIIALLLLGLPQVAHAVPYFKFIDPNHPQMSAGFLISPKAPLDTVGVIDLALVTHKAGDGSIIPLSWQSIIPPESWVPVQIGVGGSFRDELTIAPGTSANVAPIIAANLMRSVDANGSGFASALKLALQGSAQGQIRIGGALAGKVVKNGQWQSAKEAFPGQGIGEIIGNAARIDFGFGWQF